MGWCWPQIWENQRTGKQHWPEGFGQDICPQSCTPDVEDLDFRLGGAADLQTLKRQELSHFLNGTILFPASADMWYDKEMKEQIQKLLPWQNSKSSMNRLYLSVVTGISGKGRDLVLCCSTQKLSTCSLSYECTQEEDPRVSRPRVETRRSEV